MKRSEAARYARWSALLAVILVGITGGIYLQRKWTARVEKRNAPPAPPVDVERQSNALTFSKVEGNRTIFTVRAAKSTDFKGLDASLLEDVVVTVYGKTGDRDDVIHTESCKYSKADGGIQCSGKVIMDLQSAADADKARKDLRAVPNVIHVETSGVTFDHATAKAQTVQPVKFAFPNGSGEGVGAVYFSEEGHLKLIKDIRLNMTATSAVGTKKTEAPKVVTILGQSLDLDRNTHAIWLSGPATATSGVDVLSAGELTLNLDSQNRAQAMTAAPGSIHQLPKVVVQNPKGAETLDADLLTAKFSTDGSIATLLADGNVNGNSPSGKMQSQHAEMNMWARVNQPKLLTLRGDVHVQSIEPKTTTARVLSSNAVQLNFFGGQAGVPGKVQHAETLEPGTVEWSDATNTHQKLSADKLQLEVAHTGKAQQLQAAGKVQLERILKGQTPQTATSTDGIVLMDASGAWSTITLNGSVHLKQDDRTGLAQQAVFSRAAQTAVLTGKATVRDAHTETHANKITFLQNTGDFTAEGNVRSTDFGGGTSGSPQLSAAPANFSADRLQGNTKSGLAKYSGHARLWQGPSAMEAETIELQRDSRILIARGTVRAIFLQAPSQANPQAVQAGVQPSSQVAPVASIQKAPTIWHCSSDTLTYWDAENRAHLQDNVVVQSADQRFHAPSLDLYFSRDTKPGSAPGSGASQIVRAVGTGGVIVEEGDRRGTAERGVYTAADQKFVLSGGTPTLYDPVEGTTTGRELTFFIADDTIIVDSGNGTRTLTKHRVQR
jgi:lipopolysaccharide export system protein LptA